MNDSRNLEDEYFVSNHCLGNIFFYHPFEISLKRWTWFSDVVVTLIWNIINKKLQYENDTI